jgi:hypothetical protein
MTLAGKWNKNALTYKILNKNVELKDQTRFLTAIFLLFFDRIDRIDFILFW